VTATPTRILGRRELRFRKFQLDVESGPDAGKSRVADADELAIGTDAANHLVLTDTAVSRLHFSITATPAGFLLRDLGSTNGTFVGDLRVEAAYLPSGAAIRAGETTLRFTRLDDEIPAALSDADSWGRALGRSPAMRRIFAVLPRVAAAETTLLLEGETGTGKGLIAGLIHEESPRRAGPFVPVDCSAIPPSLIESELFGHEKGSFTGATQARAGVFESAAGGTLFLDEIGELPPEMQPKLLRALEEREVRRVGATRATALDVRVIAATNRDLRQEVNRGAFRSDLFYRLNTVRIRIPPLRERREDIPLLVAHFYAQLVGEHDDPDPPGELVTALARGEWPGNVRELRGAVERAVLMGSPDWELASPSTPAPTGGQAPDESFRVAKERAVARWEREWLGALVKRHDGNLSRAARAARMDRNHLRELLRRHGVAIE
jgi:DNA-binding NtrC family response regulator